MIDHVGNALVQVLVDGVQPPEDATPLEIGVVAPDEPGEFDLGLFPYAVIETPSLKNEPPVTSGPDTLRPPPLFLDVYFLLTAYSSGEQQPWSLSQSCGLLASAMLALHKNPVVRQYRLAADQFHVFEPPLHVSLNPISVEDMMRIWSGYPQKFYRLSAAYLVTPVAVPLDFELSVRRVVQRGTRVRDSRGAGR